MDREVEKVVKRWRGRCTERGERREVWSRNKHQQKVGMKPPAAGEPEQRAGEPGGNES